MVEISKIWNICFYSEFDLIQSLTAVFKGERLVYGRVLGFFCCLVCLVFFQ